MEPTAAPPLDAIQLSTDPQTEAALDASQLSTDPQTEADEAELFADDITDEELSRIMGD